MPTVDDAAGPFAYRASGILRPTGPQNIAGTAFSNGNFPKWIVPEPKSGSGTCYIYSSNGSVFTYNNISTTFSALSDAGAMSDSEGNGAEYYDNYIYFAKNTTIARYGPLNGTPTFTADFWSTTLGKAPLTDTLYPDNYVLISSNSSYPNHVLHRHSDGKLYIADVVGNQGTIHYIATQKTTVEGDTDNGSTFAKLNFGYGLWPTCIESYGSDIVIGLLESTNSGGFSGDTPGERAKVAIWDTVSQNYNLITNDEFPDQFIGAMKNVNGVLYIVSGNVGARGLRVSRYVGGQTFEEVAYIEDGTIVYPGAIEGQGTQLLFGSFTNIPEPAGCVYSLGLRSGRVSSGLFSVQRATGLSATLPAVSAIAFASNLNAGYRSPMVGWGANGVTGGLDIIPNFTTQAYSSTNPSYWWSQQFNIGRNFKVTKLRIPLAQSVASGMIVTPTIYTDNGTGTSYVGGTAPGLAIINNTNYSGKRTITMRPQNVTGENNFWLELKWTGTALCSVSLPITIEYEIIDD